MPRIPNAVRQQHPYTFPMPLSPLELSLCLPMGATWLWREHLIDSQSCGPNHQFCPLPFCVVHLSKHLSSSDSQPLNFRSQFLAHFSAYSFEIILFWWVLSPWSDQPVVAVLINQPSNIPCFGIALARGAPSALGQYTGEI